MKENFDKDSLFIDNGNNIIKYNQRIFKISTNDFFEKLEATWRCKFYSRIKDKPKDVKQFCNSTIKGIRNIISDEYKFYLKENHTDICQSKFKEEKINIEIKKEDLPNKATLEKNDKKEHKTTVNS